MKVDLNQVTLGVTDVDEAIGFYQALGLALIVHTHDAYARFECGDLNPSGKPPCLSHASAPAQRGAA